jgi:hypothetical protein
VFVSRLPGLLNVAVHAYELIHTSAALALNYAAMAEIPKRNVYVFSPSDGAPVAGKLHRSPLFLISAL